MTRNLMSKFKKPHGEDSRIVYDSRISQEGQQYPQFLTSSESRRDSVDRTQVYRTVAANHQSHKLIMRIPSLIRENAELRDKVQLLQSELKQMRYEQRHRRQSCEGRLSQREMQLHRSLRKILKECRPGSNKLKLRNESQRNGFKTEQADSRHQLVSSRIKRDSIYVEEEERESQHFRIFGEEFRKVRKERDQYKKEKDEFEDKCRKLENDKNVHREDIDHIVRKFEMTLDEKQELGKKNKAAYEQKIKALELKMSQLEGQSQILKLQNQSLTEKITNYEELLKKKQNSQEQRLSPSFWPTYWNYESSPFCIRPQIERDRTIRFSYQNQNNFS